MLQISGATASHIPGMLRQHLPWRILGVYEFIARADSIDQGHNGQPDRTLGGIVQGCWIAANTSHGAHDAGNGCLISPEENRSRGTMGRDCDTGTIDNVREVETR